MTVDWKLVLLATFVFATNKIGKAIECYQCQYASGNFPEDYNRSRTNCLNTITKNCSMTNNCAHRTVLHTTHVVWLVSYHTYCGIAATEFQTHTQECGQRIVTPYNMSCAPFPQEGYRGQACFCFGDLCNTMGIQTMNVTGAQKTSSAAVSKLNLMWALVFCLIHYGTKIKIQHFPSAVRESIGWW
ncbi:uncharacterized protein LOC129600853 isoform X2 [Paramacrobiotus metropolitanus]|uniref:uncharacterized protein LOC129600853 isoform X2 n=1 Tax=Paramacrobiotus metropolitanus TaxID=2943436 RepID=UPI00244600B4|nr:uncharacterized protein LOC129600853 isoform X2 [Paramacrobiotus metropolitanus]